MYGAHIERVESLVKEQENWRRECINLIASEQVMSNRARAAGLGFLPSLRRRTSG